MKRAVGAVLNDCLNTNSESPHLFSSRTTHSWCKWQRDKFEGTSTYKSHLNLALQVIVGTSTNKLH